MTSNALAVEEILDRILFLVDRATLLSCMTVDRSWFYSSGKLIWSHLESLRPLIELISPLYDKTETETEYLQIDYVSCHSPLNNN